MKQSDNKQNTKPDDIKYCVCAMIDLLGFSSHLEISGYDLRTSIGKQAVQRLENLESIIELLNSEKASRPEYYPASFHAQRINDAVFITMDLDDILKPSVGEAIFEGITSSTKDDFISKEQMETFEKYSSAYNSRIQEAIEPLIKFIGFISRIHISLNKIEGQYFFPGAKTVVSTGFRRPFKEDYFSANFALSNAYQAEKSLHGSSIFLDNGILHIMSFNKFAKNLLRFGHFQFRKASYDCFDNYDDLLNVTFEEASIPKPIEIKLFRKEYQFRELNPSPLTYLQNIPLIVKFLDERVTPDLSNIFFKHIFHAIKFGINRKKDESLKPPPSFVFNGTNDLRNDIGIFQEFLTDGISKTREDLKEKKFNEEYANVNEVGKRKIKELMEQTVEIDIEQIDISEIKNQLYNLSEESLNVILLVVKGDIDELDYKNEN
ncbi:hypothetical protein PQG22_03765 [Aquirufa beregesia]